MTTVAPLTEGWAGGGLGGGDCQHMPGLLLGGLGVLFAATEMSVTETPEPGIPPLIASCALQPLLKFP
jgi:hypothetical protein